MTLLNSMYTIYDKHIELLEEENADLKKEVSFLKKIVDYYREDSRINTSDTIKK